MYNTAWRTLSLISKPDVLVLIFRTVGANIVAVAVQSTSVLLILILTKDITFVHTDLVTLDENDVNTFTRVEKYLNCHYQTRHMCMFEYFTVYLLSEEQDI